jgi:TetR/AcrR family transcriptional regulator, transcriptional repressor of bet genes
MAAVPSDVDVPGRGPRRPAERYDDRRDELAESALATLGERGYANTSLRDIAQNSPFSHGVLHYYFADKTELITHGVRLYKSRCVTRYDEVVASSTTADDLLDRFAAKLAETVVDDAPMHRLWYDLRTQAMFDEGFRGAVDAIDKTLEEMIWRVVRRYSELATRPLVLPPPAIYAMLDGLFEQALRGHVEGNSDAPGLLADRVRNLLPLLLR